MKKYIFTILAAVAVLSSCGKDFLTEEPHLAQSDILTLSTFEGLDNSTAGAYAPLASTNWYGAHFILDFEMGTGNAKRWGVIFDDYESGRYTDEYAINYTANNTSPLWATAYYVILSANSVLAHVDDAGIEATDQQKNNLKAECLFLRALAHFDLVRVYAQPYNYTADHSHYGVPYVKIVDSEAKPARDKVGDVYKYIIEDLTEAEKIIDPKYVRSGVKDATASVSLEAIQALLARVYLYTSDYQNAADYATKVINSGKFKLWTVEDLEDGAVYGEDVPGKDSEVIFEVYLNTSQSYGTGNENVWGMTSYNAYGDCGVSNDLYELYDDDDVRKTLIAPDEDGNALFTLKYFGKGLGDLDAANVILLRLSEMYLTRAEAVTVGGATGYNASDDLAALAASRGTSPAQTSNEGIFEERRKELAWEGHYWFDLARTGRKMTRTDISGTVPKELAYPHNYWAKPIPAREFTVNPNLKPQNEGYSEQ